MAKREVLLFRRPKLAILSLYRVSFASSSAARTASSGKFHRSEQQYRRSFLYLDGLRCRKYSILSRDRMASFPKMFLHRPSCSFSDRRPVEVSRVSDCLSAFQFGKMRQRIKLKDKRHCDVSARLSRERRCILRRNRAARDCFFRGIVDNVGSTFADVAQRPVEHDVVAFQSALR